MEKEQHISREFRQVRRRAFCFVMHMFVSCANALLQVLEDMTSLLRGWLDNEADPLSFQKEHQQLSSVGSSQLIPSLCSGLQLFQRQALYRSWISHHVHRSQQTEQIEQLQNGPPHALCTPDSCLPCALLTVMVEVLLQFGRGIQDVVTDRLPRITAPQKLAQDLLLLEQQTVPSLVK